jgi:hypothetical protein
LPPVDIVPGAVVVSVPGAPVYVYGVPTLPHIKPPPVVVVNDAPTPPSEVMLVGVPNIAEYE